MRFPSSPYDFDAGWSDDGLELTITDVTLGARADGYHPVALRTSRGEVQLRHYPVHRAQAGVIFAGGTGGGWDTPGHGRLFPDLCDDLKAGGVTALRVRYRHPTDLEESTLDVLAGVYFLDGLGVERVALVGHSFGGAVVIQAAANVESVAALVALSTQSHGVEPARDLPVGCASLFLHGEADEILPPACSRLAYRLAPEPKKLSLYPNVRHGLDEAAEDIRAEVRAWLLRHTGMERRV